MDKNQTTVKSRLGNIFGANRVQIYNRAVAQDKAILTQKPISLETRLSVIMLDDVQLVISIPT
jgi:hypothetical protein